MSNSLIVKERKKLIDVMLIKVNYPPTDLCVWCFLVLLNSSQSCALAENFLTRLLCNNCLAVHFKGTFSKPSLEEVWLSYGTNIRLKSVLLVSRMLKFRATQNLLGTNASVFALVHSLPWFALCWSISNSKHAFTKPLFSLYLAPHFSLESYVCSCEGHLKLFFFSKRKRKSR